MGSLVSKRIISKLSSICPTAHLTAGLIVGQLLTIRWGYISIALLFYQGARFGIERLSITPRGYRLNGLWWGILIGIASIYYYNIVTPELELSSDRSYLAQVIADPRYRRVGEKELALKVKAIIKSGDSVNSRTSQKLPREPNYLCRGAHLPWRNLEKVKQGDHIIIWGGFSSLNENSGLISYDAYLKRQGFSGNCKLRYVSQVITTDRAFYSTVRGKFKKSLEKLLGQGESSGLPLSMSVGSKDVLTIKTEESFKRTGLAHLLVVSGYQVTLIFVSVVFIVTATVGRIRSLISRVPLLYISNMFGLGFVYAFIFLVGSDGPVLRAGVSITLFVIAKVFERGGSGISILVSSLFIMSLFMPGTYLDPGVELSYAALLGLILGDRLAGDSPLKRYLYSSLLASFFTSLIGLAWFGGFSLGSLILNPIIAPLLSYVGCKGVIVGWILYVSSIDRTGVVLTGLSQILQMVRDLVIELSNEPFIYFESSTVLFVIVGFFIVGSILLIFRSSKIKGLVPCQ